MNLSARPVPPLDLALRQQQGYERLTQPMSPRTWRTTTRAMYYGAGYADGWREAREWLLAELTALQSRPIPTGVSLDERHDIRYRRKGISDAIHHLSE